MIGAYKIDHIAIAVRSIKESLAFWETRLGLACDGQETVADQGVHTAFLVAGESHVELLEPTSLDTHVGKFLAQRGEGLHHIALGVPDVEAAIAAARAAGLRMIDEQPRPGARGARIAFVHPKSTGGILVEFCERK